MISAAVVLFLALATGSYQAIKIAMTSLAERLRHE
jgi:hypothetical protein